MLFVFRLVLVGLLVRSGLLVLGGRFGWEAGRIGRVQKAGGLWQGRDELEIADRLAGIREAGAEA